MSRNVTAIYRTFATTDLVRQKLGKLGISSGDIHVIPDRDDPVGTSGRRSDDRCSHELHYLHLPDEDLKTCEQSVRHRDYVVSAEVDEQQVGRVQGIMSRPEDEAYNLG